MRRSTRRRSRSGATATASYPMRGQLIEAIKARIARLALTQVEAAQMLGITAPRLNLLIHGHVEYFSVDALINLTARLGLNVRLRITRPYATRRDD